MGKSTIKFGDQSAEKSNLYKKDTKIFEIEDIDVYRIKTSVKNIYSQKKNKSYKYYIGYDDNDEIIPLIIRLPQMIGYYNIFEDGNKTMYFRCDDK